MHGSRRNPLVAGALGLTLALGLASPVAGQLDLGPEELVQAGGVDIDVPGYSIPSFAHWNEDGLPDLIVGEGTTTGRVRVYLNVGTLPDPQFNAWFYAQSNGSDLTVPGSG